jgi:integrase/recombinase XerC
MVLVAVFGGDCATNPCWSPSSSQRPSRSPSRPVRWEASTSARMRDALPAFVRHLLADHNAPRTVKTYGVILASFATFHPNLDIPTRALVEVFLARPRRDGAQRASTSRNQELAALRSFSAFALRELGWTTNPTDGIPFVREPPHDPAVLTAAELRELFETAANSSRPGERARNLALLAVLSQTGLRVHEAVGLDVHQVDLSSATLLAVRGKGGTIHDLPLNAPAAALLGVWITERDVREGERALFLSLRGTRLSIRATEALVARLRSRMGSATLTLTAGTDLATVAELLRHQDVNTTRRYLHLVDTRRREAVRRLAGTIPSAVLPVTTTAANPGESTAPLPESREAPVSPGPFDLDDQHGLVAAA